MHSVSIVGCGYTGLRLARRTRATGAVVRGFATSEASLAAIEAAGALPIRLDLDGPPQPVDCAAEIVYYSVPPAPTGTADARFERFLQQAVGRPQRVVYLSTTGVYGDARGASVDEETPPAPSTARAVRRLAAETLLRRWADSRGISWCILRIPGIYGPGRLPLERLRRGDPAIQPGEAGPGNRVHVEDLVSACVAAGVAPQAHGRLYNVTDGSDDTLTDYLQRVARICGLPSPPLVSRDEAKRLASASAWSFAGESRRVDNRRMVRELGVTPAFTDLDDGIRASL